MKKSLGLWPIVLLGMFISALGLSSTNYVYANEGRVAIFQFSADSMNAVGIDSEVAFSIRNELAKRKEFVLVTQRDMEVELARNDISQTFNRTEAQRAAKALGADYVLIGTVKRLGANIIADVELISVLSKIPVETWVFSFQNQQSIARDSVIISEQISAAIGSASRTGVVIAKSEVLDWAKDFKATVTNANVDLEWSLAPNVAIPIGYNIYRSENANGPFSYLTSVVESTYNDDLSGMSEAVFYQVGLLKDDGEEIRNPSIIEVIPELISQSKVLAPVVIDFKPLRSGPSLEILPSAQNSGEMISAYQLMRKIPQGNWRVVDEVLLTDNANGRANSTIGRYTLVDRVFSEVESEASYAVRAIAGAELGQLSENYYYKSPAIPMPQVNNAPLLRKVSLSWQPISNSQGYYVYRRQNASAEWAKVSDLLPSNKLQFDDTDFEDDGQSFEYAISVVDEYGETPLSLPNQASTKGKIEAPLNIKASSPQIGQISLKWDNVSDPDAIGYAIYRAPYTSGDSVWLEKIADVAWSESPSFIDDQGIVEGAPYQYSVAAVNSFGGTGKLSEAITGRTKTGPLAVSELRFEQSGKHTTLSWVYDDSLIDSQFLIERKISEQEWEQLAILEVSEQEFQDDLEPQTKSVIYRITVIDRDSMMSKPMLIEITGSSLSSVTL